MRKKTATIFILSGLLLCVPSLSERVLIERENRNVLLLSSESNELGHEKRLDEWVENSYAGRWFPGVYSPFEEIHKDDSFTLIFSERGLFKHAKEVLRIKTDYGLEYKEEEDSFYLKVKGAAWSDLKDMGMGLLPGEYSYVRPVNDEYVNEEFIRWYFEGVSPWGIIFKGSEVLGFPDNIEMVNSLLREKNVKVFLTEFHYQRGFKDVSRKTEIVLLHSLPYDLESGYLIPRVTRALIERKVRAFYIHGNKLSEVEEAVEKSGFVAGKPSPFRGVRKVNNIAALIGALVSLFGLFSWMTEKKIFSYVFFGAALVSSLFFIAYFESALNFIAIFCAVLFPMAAIKNSAEVDTGFSESAAVYILFSLSAGLLIAALSVTHGYLSGARYLRGVKLSLAIPVIFAGWIFFKNRLKLEDTVKKGEALLFLLFMGIMIVYLMRSSNISSGVFSIELRFRRLLEEIFIIRPRFKEFLWGYPLLFAGLYYYKKYSRDIYAFMVVMGTVAPVSVINTFMHIHSPLTVQLVRTLWGLLLGALFGVVLVKLISTCQN